MKACGTWKPLNLIMINCIIYCSDHEGGNVSAHTGHLVSWPSFVLHFSHILIYNLIESLIYGCCFLLKLVFRVFELFSLKACSFIQ